MPRHHGLVLTHRVGRGVTQTSELRARAACELRELVELTEPQTSSRTVARSAGSRRYILAREHL